MLIVEIALSQRTLFWRFSIVEKTQKTRRNKEKKRGNTVHGIAQGRITWHGGGWMLHNVGCYCAVVVAVVYKCFERDEKRRRVAQSSEIYQ